MDIHKDFLFGCLFFFLHAILHQVQGIPEPGILKTVLNAENPFFRAERPLLANTKIFIKMSCKSNPAVNVSLSWKLTERECWIIELANEENLIGQNRSKENVRKSSTITQQCNEESHKFFVPELITPDTDVPNEQNRNPRSSTSNLVAVTTEDGIYDLVLTINLPAHIDDFSAPVHIEFYGPHGYISATDWPLLPFYGIMCLVYLIYGMIWLIVSFLQWRDLLRIQFWIGGVILLGMLEKAFFYEEYQSLNSNGIPIEKAELAAEFVSCAKRTLARMLVIIMSLGFGIVKPRLGPLLHRVVGVGTLYFFLACVESYLRITKTKPDERNELLVASIPLAVLDTGICWWIFTSLVQTTRTLRLRRNMVKLSLYRHFTNTLIFSVIASVIFMLFAMRLHKTENCTPGWRDIWIDTAFWHILFSVLLLVIMILWRPTNNNQRYAFTPLLDNPEDEDDEEEDQFVADAYGVKMRGATNANGGTRTNQQSSSTQRTTTTEDDDLRWVEENIPSSIAEPTLPILDSDEEIINTKFEVSKMQ